MPQAEIEKLTQILWGAALSRAVWTITELGIADQIGAGSPQSVDSVSLPFDDLRFGILETHYP